MAEIQEIRVNSWSELQGALYTNAWRADIERYRSPYAFRGQAEAEHGLETSLCRLGGNFPRMEGHLLRNFRKYASTREVEQDSVWNWLALAKHHGLPTRLLDWSFSPLVAMHFATDNIRKFDLDGAIWMVNYHRVHEELPPPLRQALEEEGSDVFTVEMLSCVAETLKAFDRLSKDPFVLFIEPPSIDERIVNQFALFSLMSDVQASLEDWLRKRPEFYQKIILPAELKWEVRDKLDQANITERVLFPGLDGLSAWLKRQYSPKNLSSSKPC